MFSQVTVACFLVAGIACQRPPSQSSEKCNPPKTLIGKFCNALLNNDFDKDGIVTNKGIDHDLVTYNYDDDLCNLERWEVARGLKCKYGYSEGYANYSFTSWDVNGDGVVSMADFSVPFEIPAQQFLVGRLVNLRDEWCRHSRYIPNPEDQELCAEAEKLKEEELKCNFE